MSERKTGLQHNDERIDRMNHQQWDGAEAGIPSVDKYEYQRAVRTSVYRRCCNIMDYCFREKCSTNLYTDTKECRH